MRVFVCLFFLSLRLRCSLFLLLCCCLSFLLILFVEFFSLSLSLYLSFVCFSRGCLFACVCLFCAHGRLVVLVVCYRFVCLCVWCFGCMFVFARVCLSFRLCMC